MSKRSNTEGQASLIGSRRPAAPVPGPRSGPISSHQQPRNVIFCPFLRCPPLTCPPLPWPRSGPPQRVIQPLPGTSGSLPVCPGHPHRNLRLWPGISGQLRPAASPCLPPPSMCGDLSWLVRKLSFNLLHFLPRPQDLAALKRLQAGVVSPTRTEHGTSMRQRRRP